MDAVLRTGKGGDLFGLRRGGLSIDKLRRDHPHGLVLSDQLPTGVMREKLRTPGKKVQLAPPEIVEEVGRLEAIGAGDPAFPMRLISMRELRSHNSWMHNSPLLMRGGRVHALRVHPDDASVARTRGWRPGIGRVEVRVGKRAGRDHGRHDARDRRPAPRLGPPRWRLAAGEREPGRQREPAGRARMSRTSSRWPAWRSSTASRCGSRPCGMRAPPPWAIRRWRAPPPSPPGYTSHMTEGEGPAGPIQLRWASWRAALRRTVDEFLEDQLLDWAAALTYYGTLALFPGLIAMVSLLALLGDPVGTEQAIPSILGKVAPESAVAAIRGARSNRSSPTRGRPACCSWSASPRRSSRRPDTSPRSRRPATWSTRPGRGGRSGGSSRSSSSSPLRWSRCSPLS